MQNHEQSSQIDINTQNKNFSVQDDKSLKIEELSNNQVQQPIPQFIESNIQLQQSPDNNFAKELLMHMENSENQIVLSYSPQNFSSSINKVDNNYKDNQVEEDKLFQNTNQLLAHPQTPKQQNIQNIQLQSRSKSLFFQQRNKIDSNILEKKNSLISESSKNSVGQKEDESANNNNLQNIQADNSDNFCSEADIKTEQRRETIPESFNQLKQYDSIFSTQKSIKQDLMQRKYSNTKESKIYGFSSSAINNYGETPLNKANQSSFNIKSEKLIQESQKRYDHQKKSFQFTNFIKHEESDGENSSIIQTNTNKQSNKVVPLNFSIVESQNLGSDVNQYENKISLTSNLIKPKKIGWNLAVQLKNVNRFISKIRDQTSDLNYVKLKTHHLNYINDPSFQHEEGSGQYFQMKYDHIQKRFLSAIPIFEPDNSLLITFKVCVIVALIIQIFIVPIQIGFQVNLYDENRTAEICLRIIPIILFLIDFLCRMNTGFYQNGNFIEKRRDVIMYFKFILILDLINIIVITFNIVLSVPFLLIIFISRVFLVNLKISDISDHFSLMERYPSAYNITKLSFILLLVAHVCGCGFHFISTINMGEYTKNNWIEFYHFSNYDIKNRYILSIYYSTITMITVGYGDITPQNQIERIYVICIVIISGTVFAYAVNMIGAIFQEKEKKIADYKQMKFDISNYMINRSISKKTQLKVYNYLEYIFKKESESPEKGQKILNLISEDLKNSVYKEFYQMILTNSKLFSHKFSKEFIQKVSLRMEEKMYAPGELIYQQGASENPILYYILKGKVDLYAQKGDSKYFLGSLKTGDSMGHHNFYACLPLDYSCTTSEVTHLVYITQENFIQCLKEFPLDQEVFTMNKDDIIFGQQRYMNPCFSCGKFIHSVIDCPLIHYQKNKQFFISRHLHSVQEKERKSHQRQHLVKRNSLKIIKRVRNALKVTRTAMEYSYFQNTKIQGSQITLNDLETDKQFYLRMTKFKFNQDNNLVMDSQISEGEEEEFDLEDYEIEQEEQNSQISQAKEIQELKEEDDYTQRSLNNITIKKFKNNQRLQRFGSCSSFKMGENDQEKAQQNMPLYKRTLTNQNKLKQIKKQDSNQSCSVDGEKFDELNCSLLLKKISSNELNQQPEKIDVIQKKQSSKKIESLPQTTQFQKEIFMQQQDFQNSQKNQDLNKYQNFKLNLQPIQLFGNHITGTINKQNLDDSLSPFQVILDDRNKIKITQEINSNLVDHLNNSQPKTSRQGSIDSLKQKKSSLNKEQQKPQNIINIQPNMINGLPNNLNSMNNLNYVQIGTPLLQSNQTLTGLPNITKNNKQLNNICYQLQQFQQKKENLNTQTLKPQILPQNFSNNNLKIGEIQNIKFNTVQQVQNVNNLQQNTMPINQPYYQAYQENAQNQNAQNQDSLSPSQINNFNLNLLNPQLLNHQNFNQIAALNQHNNYFVQQLIKRIEEFSIPNFEAMKEYTIYFVQYNYTQVLKKIQKKQIPIKKKKNHLNQSKLKGKKKNGSKSFNILPH
ncbi:cyclic nucleotide-binding domain protein (macronuclear) [Tetrahymena thermophila SB210]|uniref:Cyclic nucleotide-binding domain protein n=1 Tax=Tetrahymena thermophila (strain SB210) TaxID=312017 RepID=I7MAT8_TETTS|nr:cyclic nucleotide-binding domain protein [Tetrahymena thermophila SB210]EAS06128.2 cyclic nucleotide-binding domain protein [Tetrahymena thermophila SB210]|eukprot:XP_001026373.2 cyclic nucleotide-binding domain protein [Tetrahymena thermophila SB210]